jgi:hypothetical protein
MVMIVMILCVEGSLWAMEGDLPETSPHKKTSHKDQKLRDQRVEHLQAMLDKAKMAVQNIQKLEETHVKENSNLKEEIFKLKKRICYLYVIIGIELGICCGCFALLIKEKAIQWWQNFKEWKYEYHAQSVPRDSHESLSASEKSGQTFAPRF